jgi:uroporphyrinogen decarboxylase
MHTEYNKRTTVIDTIHHRSCIMPSHENFQDDVTRWRLVSKPNTGCWYLNWLLYSEMLDNYMIELHPFPWSIQILEQDADHIVQRLQSGVVRKIQLDPWFMQFSDHPIQAPCDISRMDILNPYEEGLYNDFETAFSLYHKHGYFTVAGLGGSVFWSVAEEWRELSQLLCDMALQPDFAHEMFDRMGEYLVAKEKILLQMGVDCIYFEDDLGYKNGPFMSPEMFQKFLLPWYKKICDIAHAHGCYTYMHSHGDINKLLPSIIDCGVDILNPVGPTDNMDLAEVKSQYGDRITILGGLSKNIGLMDYDELEQHIENVIQIGSQEGGFIPRGESGITADMDSEKFRFYMDRMRTYRLRYSFQAKTTKNN